MKPSAIFLFMVVLCLTAVSCATNPGEETSKGAKNSKGGTASAEARDRTGPPKGVIDAIDGDPVVGGGLSLRGWAADPAEGAPVKKVDVVLDGKVIAQATTGLSRQDVADAYHRADWLKSGWTADIYLNDVKPGSHKIDVIVYDSKNLKGFLTGSKVLAVKAANQKTPS